VLLEGIRKNNKSILNIRVKHILQAWPNYGSQAASDPPTSLIQSAKYLGKFFQAPRFHCRQQCNSIGCCLSLVGLSAAAALSCKQRYKCKQNGVILLLLFYCDTFQQTIFAYIT